MTGFAFGDRCVNAGRLPDTISFIIDMVRCAERSFRGLQTSTKGPIGWHDGGDGVRIQTGRLYGGMGYPPDPQIRLWLCPRCSGVNPDADPWISNMNRFGLPLQEHPRKKGPN